MPLWTVLRLYYSVAGWRDFHFGETREHLYEPGNNEYESGIPTNDPRFLTRFGDSKFIARASQFWFNLEPRNDARVRCWDSHKRSLFPGTLRGRNSAQQNAPQKTIRPTRTSHWVGKLLGIRVYETEMKRVRLLLWKNDGLGKRHRQRYMEFVLRKATPNPAVLWS